jgi:hypothetical protein
MYGIVEGKIKNLLSLLQPKDQVVIDIASPYAQPLSLRHANNGWEGGIGRH